MAIVAPALLCIDGRNERPMSSAGAMTAKTFEPTEMVVSHPVKRLNLRL